MAFPAPLPSGMYLSATVCAACCFFMRAYCRSRRSCSSAARRMHGSAALVGWRRLLDHLSANSCRQLVTLPARAPTCLPYKETNMATACATCGSWLYLVRLQPPASSPASPCLASLVSSQSCCNHASQKCPLMLFTRPLSTYDKEAGCSLSCSMGTLEESARARKRRTARERPTSGATVQLLIQSCGVQLHRQPT